MVGFHIQEMKMAFTEIGFSRRVTGVTFGMLASHVKGAKLTSKVRIGADILLALGWKKGDRIAFFWGTGPDLGKLHLRKNEFGVLLISAGRSVTTAVQTSRTPAESCKTMNQSTVVKYKIDDGLRITLPDWFYQA